jgi:MFS family permease
MVAAMAALLLLLVPGAGLGASLLFGLVGMAPAGVIIALAGHAVAVERRAFGMGVFLTIYYAIITAAPPVAGWIVDRPGRRPARSCSGAALFALVLPATMLFRVIKSKPARCKSCKKQSSAWRPAAENGTQRCGADLGVECGEGLLPAHPDKCCAPAQGRQRAPNGRCGQM